MVSAVLALLLWQVVQVLLVCASLSICAICCMRNFASVSHTHTSSSRVLSRICFDDSALTLQARSLAVAAVSSAPVTVVTDEESFAAALLRGAQNVVVTNHLDLTASSVSLGLGTSSISVRRTYVHSVRRALGYTMVPLPYTWAVSYFTIQCIHFTSTALVRRIRQHPFDPHYTTTRTTRYLDNTIVTLP